MATKKPLKAAKPAARQSIKKSAPAKKVAAKGKAPAKSAAKKSAPAKKSAAKAVVKKAVAPKKVAKATKPAVKAVAAKKPAPKIAVKNVAKPTALKTTKKPVKKAIDKNDSKKATPAKNTVVAPEKKVAGKAATPAVAKAEPKKAAAVKAAAEVKPVAEPKAAPAKVASVPAAKAAAKKAEQKPAKPVVIPKTSTDKKVDYEPDFMKSVLDTPAPAPQGPTMRYSDQELQEFRDLINKKLDAAKKELAYLQGLITRRDEMGGDETDNRYMTMEDGGMSMEREQLSQMASRQITFIDHLEKAIMRIENKTYGICRVTGKLIDKARLRAVPHATLSMEAKLGIVK
jgi:RNA polymerase-binding transcription factor DksA